MGDVSYCTASDGVRIAYSAEGTGVPLLLCHNPYAFSLSHLVPALDTALRRIGRGRRLIRYDIRGTGLSQLRVDDVSLASLVKDIEAVADAMALESFILFAPAFGGTRAIEYAATYPNRLGGLVLFDTFPRFADAYPLPVLNALVLLCRGNWKLATRTFADSGVRRQDELEGLRWAEMIEQSLTGDMMAKLIEANIPVDVTAQLSKIECPTLVCHSRKDGLFPFSFGQEMAEKIPGARLILLEGDPAGPFANTKAAIEALETTMQAVDTYLSPAMPTPYAAVEPGALSPRELDVLRLIAAGRTSSEIARELGLSVRTVGRHITNLYNKIGANGRADATKYALRHGIAAE